MGCGLAMAFISSDVSVLRRAGRVRSALQSTAPGTGTDAPGNRLGVCDAGVGDARRTLGGWTDCRPLVPSGALSGDLLPALGDPALDYGPSRLRLSDFHG